MSLLFLPQECLFYRPGDRLLLIRNFVLCGEVAVLLIESGYIFFVGKRVGSVIMQRTFL